jgi:hypothetical protein
MRPADWNRDIYEGRLAVRERIWITESTCRISWRWATLKPGWVALAEYEFPNEHHSYCPRSALAVIFATGDHPDALFCDHAVAEGVLMLGRPLTADEIDDARHIRFGRIAVGRGRSCTMYDGDWRPFYDRDDLIGADWLELLDLQQHLRQARRHDEADALERLANQRGGWPWDR